ncbi:MAG: ATP-binding protein [Smithellaceae bacterium]|nr:ATP-binding protein [Smithellaceae bacterium]
MLELALHILDIAENSVRAGAKTVNITIEEDVAEDRLTLTIADDGRGMDEATCRKALDPFFTSKKVRRVGLGLPMLSQAAERTGGSLELRSKEGEGTTVRVAFGLSHIDRQPLGDVAGAIMILIAGNAGCDFVYRHRRGSGLFELNTREIRDEIEDVPIGHPEVLKLIRDNIYEGLKEIGASA